MAETLIYRVHRVDWAADGMRARAIRNRVFIQELGIPEQLEWDGKDETSTHFIAETANGNAVGTARLLASGQIGRMAVLPSRRGKGVGSLLMNEIIVTAREMGFEEVFLHAQVSALDFYLRRGFQPSGEIFEAAGIPHQTMRMTVQ